MYVKDDHRPLWRRRYDAFVASRKGATAVEFALIAFPLFFLIFGLIEIALLFIMSSTLDYGMAEAARKIRTGQLQTQGGVGADEFKAEVCNNMFDLMDCAGQLRVEVKVFASWNDTDESLPIDEDGNMEEDLPFAMGGPNDIVMVRIFYDWSLITPVMSAELSNMNGGKRLLTSTMVFRNEPY